MDAPGSRVEVDLDTVIDVPGRHGEMRLHIELAAAPQPPPRRAGRPAARAAAWEVIEHLAALALAALG
jgi:hypothetical protein